MQLERQLIARLKTANIHFTDAQVERIWAIVSAHHAGLSIRKIADTTGLSSSRIHQLFNAPEVEVLRRCTDWLQRGENVVVNLRPDEDVETELVAFDRPREVRVLERIAADLDTLSLVPNDPHPDKESNHHDPRARHRHELAEPPPNPKKLSHRERRTALRAALGLPILVLLIPRLDRSAGLWPP